MPPWLLDLSEVGEALNRGEMPLEVLAAGSIVALVVGITLALLVASLRRRRPAPEAAPDPGELPRESIDEQATSPWGTQDTFRPAHRPPGAPLIDAQAQSLFRADAPSAELAAAQPYGWPMDAPAADGLEAPIAWEPAPRPAPAFPIWERPDAEPPAVEVAAVQSALATRADTEPERGLIGTPRAPLVVELRDERDPAADDRGGGPNLPRLVAIGTVAVGVAFSAGAAVGATLGVGAGAAIGLAFAGGAGVAIGATVALLGRGRR